MRTSEQFEGWRRGRCTLLLPPREQGEVSDVATATKFPSQQRSWKATDRAAAGIKHHDGML